MNKGWRKIFSKVFFLWILIFQRVYLFCKLNVYLGILNKYTHNSILHSFEKTWFTKKARQKNSINTN